MDESEIARRLNDVVKSLVGVKAQVAWIALKADEWRPGDPPMSMSNSDLLADLRNEEAHFAHVASDLSEIVTNGRKHDLSKKQCELYRRRLLSVEAEFQRLMQGKTL